jgi:hypothetical protein
MKKPGETRNIALAETYLVREAALVRDLVGFFLKNPASDKAEEYFTYFQDQWRQNIVNYVKNINGQQIVHKIEIDQYKSHYKYRTAVRLVEEYVTRSKELDKMKARYPYIPVEKNKVLFGLYKNRSEIHSRLIPFFKILKEAVNSPENAIRI